MEVGSIENEKYNVKSAYNCLHDDSGLLSEFGFSAL